MMIAVDPNDHEHFEELCALAALGQISEREFVELKSHLEVCAGCRFEQADYLNLMHHKLPLVMERRQGLLKQVSRLPRWSRDRSLKSQFLERAERNGWRFSEASQPTQFWSRLSSLKASLSPKFAFSLVLILAFASIAFLGYRLRDSFAKNAALAAQIGKLNDENAAFHRHSSETPKVGIVKPVAPATVIVKTEPGKEGSAAADLLADELSKARDEHATALTRVQALESQLQAAATEAQTLRTEVETGKSKGSQLETRLRESEASLNQMNEEIQKLRNARASNAGNADQLVAQEARVKELSDRLKAQSEVLDRERSLLAAGRDIRDLMGARNLHIIDVFDVDGKGKNNRSFGRVFYTEGKSLIFYAFDLGDRRTSLAKASYQAWGYQASNGQSFESLGIFYVDDKNQNRWVLKYDDPEILAQIDSVFVTIEPSGGSPRPTGNKLLYAYLNNRPNHP
jgi:hypothetical protein